MDALLLAIDGIRTSNGSIQPVIMKAWQHDGESQCVPTASNS